MPWWDHFEIGSNIKDRMVREGDIYYFHSPSLGAHLSCYFLIVRVLANNVTYMTCFDQTYRWHSGWLKRGYQKIEDRL